MSSYYPVQEGQTITDVVINSTGSIANWDIILQANGFDQWVPQLTPGQMIIIPDTVTYDLNALRNLQDYPANNYSVPDVAEQIAALDALTNNNWILSSGRWNDNAVWQDTKNWID